MKGRLVTAGLAINKKQFNRKECSDDAFVLIAVLWIVGVIAAATMAFVLTVQVQVKTAANARQVAMLEQTTVLDAVG